MSGTDESVDLNKWVQEALLHPKNIATEAELTEQATSALLAFRRADADGSNELSIPELMNLCEAMGLPVEADEEETLMKIDADDSGEISIEEWLKFWLKRVSTLPNPAKQQEAIARNTFRKFDKDGSGSLDLSELGDLIKSLGANFTEREMQDAIRELDSDGSGLIEMSEFVDWWVDRAVNSRSKGGVMAMKLKKLAKKASQIFFTDIFTAVWQNDVNLVKSFLESDARIANASDTSEYGEGWTSLHYACYQGFDDIINELLSAGASVNAVNDLGFSPLFYAAQRNHVHICKILLERGADPFICGAPLDDPALFMCPVDHVVDSIELRKLFRGHPKCQRPQAVAAGKVNATVTDTGVLSIELPPHKTYSMLPPKSWKIQLNILRGSWVSKASDGVYELAVPGQNPNLSKYGSSEPLVANVDKRWLKLKYPDGPPGELLMRMAATNSLGDEGPMSDEISVKYTRARLQSAPPSRGGSIAKSEAKGGLYDDEDVKGGHLDGDDFDDAVGDSGDEYHAEEKGGESDVDHGGAGQKAHYGDDGEEDELLVVAQGETDSKAFK